MRISRYGITFFAAFVPLAWLAYGPLSPLRAQVQDGPIVATPRTNNVALSGSADRAAPSIRINSDLVLIPVLVTDKDDRLISGLDRTHFRVYEDKVEQSITQFSSEDIPVSIGIVFDCSGSMGAKMKKARAAVNAFLNTANPEDDFSLVTFSDRARITHAFTNRTQDIQDALMLTESKGATALLDAIYLSMNEMKHASHNRKAILILSDGGDNDSRYTTREIKRLVREKDIQIYSIGILEPLGARFRSLEEAEGPTLLDDISRETGGRLYEADDPNELPGIALRIGAALRNEYVLGYAPSEAKRDGKYHRVQVKIERAKGFPMLQVSFRTGYYAPAK